MKRLFFICLLFVSFCANATYEIAGDYSGYGESDLDMRIVVLDDLKGVVAVSASTSTSHNAGCSGAIAGIGNYADNVLKFSNYTKEEGAENCVITVSFKNAKKGKKIGIVSEGENCSVFHGASCSFDGKITQKVKQYP